MISLWKAFEQRLVAFEQEVRACILSTRDCVLTRIWLASRLGSVSLTTCRLRIWHRVIDDLPSANRLFHLALAVGRFESELCKNRRLGFDKRVESGPTRADRRCDMAKVRGMLISDDPCAA